MLESLSPEIFQTWEPFPVCLSGQQLHNKISAVCELSTLWQENPVSTRGGARHELKSHGVGGGGWEWYSIYPLLTCWGRSHSFTVCSNAFLFFAFCTHNQTSSVLLAVYDVKLPSFPEKSSYRPGVFQLSNTVIISRKWKQILSWSPYFQKQWRN